MPLSAAAVNFSHGWAEQATHAALYQSVEVTGHLNEVDGSILDELLVPIYQRQPVALNLESEGTRSAHFPVVFTVPAGTTICWYGLLDINGTLLSLEPISASVISNTPQPCLFNDFATGWIDTPGGLGVGDFVVFWSAPSPSSALTPTGGYTTLPSNVWAYGPYQPFPVRDRLGGRFSVNDAIGITDEARFGPDGLIPSNYGWGYCQRIDPVSFAEDGTYSLDSIRVRTTG